MKIAHLPFCYWPDPPGGTEIYVRDLAREQQRAGDEVCIIAPGEVDATYEYEAVRVHRYAVQSALADIRELYHAHTSVSLESFARSLAREKPDVLHVHGYGRAVTSRMIEAARAQGIRIVFTYHTPTATCVRGTMMRFGETVCDGALDARHCAACMLQGRGVPRVLASVAALTPTWPTSMLRAGRAATGLRMRELVRLRHDEIRRFLASVDHVIAPAQWVFDLLLRLRVPGGRLTLNRQGTALDRAAGTSARSENVRLVFLGRLDHGKGIELLLSALEAIPKAKLELHIYGVQQDDRSNPLARRAASDSRVVMHEAVSSDALPEVLSHYDALVVPSQLLETGPLVVLEAFAAGLPVVGSRLGGIAELVRDGIDGVLIEARDQAAWSAALQRISGDRVWLEQLRSGVQRPRTMAQVARDMRQVYAHVLRPA